MNKEKETQYEENSDVDELNIKDIDDILYNLVEIKSRIGGGYIKLCPKCVTTAVRELYLTGVLVPSKYYCPNCGWTGYVPLEADIDELIKHFEELVKEHEEKNRKQDSP